MQLENRWGEDLFKLGCFTDEVASMVGLCPTLLDERLGSNRWKVEALEENDQEIGCIY